MSHSKSPSRPRVFTVGRSLLLLGMLAGIAGIIWLSGFEKTFTVSEAKAQELLDVQVEKYRTEHPNDTIDYATLDFGQNEMTIKAAGGRNMSTEKYGEFMVTAAVSATGDPDYRQRSVYFLPTQGKDSFDVSDLKLNGEDPLEVAKRTIATFATEAPIVRDALRDDTRVKKGLSWLKEKAGVSVELDDTANNAAIKAAEAAANNFVERYRIPAETFMEGLVIQLLSSTPLYTLDNNWKEMVAAAALTDIGIVDGQLTATITGWQVIKTAFFGLLLIGASLLFAVGIMRGGGAGAVLWFS